MNFSPNRFKSSFSLDFNIVIKSLIASDIFILSGFGLVTPIFGLFIVDNIAGASLEVVGMAATIYLFTRSLGQIPLSFVIDKIKGEKDDFMFMFIGSLVTSLVPLFYVFITDIWQLYLIQGFYGISQAATYPSWYALFTRHVDKDKEGREWGTYSTLVDLGGATVAGIGGYLSYHFGFVPIFIIVSIMSFIGSLFLLYIRSSLKFK